jgi:putative NADPH-quinone reductase
LIRGAKTSKHNLTLERFSTIIRLKSVVQYFNIYRNQIGVFSMSTNMPQQPNEERRFLFLLTSARKNGNAEYLTRLAAAALSTSVEQSWIRLSDTPLAPFHDIRHEGSGNYPEPKDNERTLVEKTLNATDLVIAAPLYWYSVPASAKLYLDYWAGWMRVAGLDFKKRMEGKQLWAITVISDEDDSTADPLIGTLRLTANYMHMDWRGVLIGHGNRPGDVEKDAKAIAAAAKLLNL